MEDQVDLILAQWASERPDVDTAPMGTIGRISRAAQYIDKALRENFRQHDLSSGDFDVMATLRRSGEPYQLTPTDLFNTLMLTSGTMTNRLDRLEKAGYISRTPNPEDRRGFLVCLSPEGKLLIDLVVETHCAKEKEMLSQLTSAETAQLTKLLRKLLLSFGDGVG